MIEDAYIARVAERAATDAAFKLATKGPEMVVNGRREEVWRARPDGVVELVRAHCGRVELLEVLGDGTSLLVATSPRSIRKIAMTICEYAAFVSFVVGCLGSIFAPGGGFTVLLALALLLFPLSFCSYTNTSTGMPCAVSLDSVEPSISRLTALACRR